MPKNMITPLEKYFFKEDTVVSDQHLLDEQGQNW